MGYFSLKDSETKFSTTKHSSRMRTDHAVTRMSSDRVADCEQNDKQTPVKTLPSVAVGNEQR